jgi:ABC-type sugar transport system ATPase subunit
VAVVELRGLSKTFPNGVEAVASVDLAVGERELVAIVGPSGSGKSTLLRLIAGLESPSAGSVWIGGRDVSSLGPRERDVAMVFQHPALYPYLSVFDNLAFGLRSRGMPRHELKARVEETAEILGLKEVLRRRPQTLSGGQRQRVALGRAIVRRPAVFLLDEPLSALDTPLRASIRSELLSLHRRLGATMIHVTHDQAEALAMGDHVAVMEQGRIVQVGTPQVVYRHSATRFVATFLGNPPMNLVPCTLISGEGFLRIKFEGLDELIDLPDAPANGSLAEWVGKALDLGLRPEHLAVSCVEEGKDPAYLWIGEAAVEGIEFLGHESVAILRLDPHTLRARVPGTSHARPGEAVAIGLDLARASWFDSETGAAIAAEEAAPAFSDSPQSRIAHEPPAR